MKGTQPVKLTTDPLYSYLLCSCFSFSLALSSAEFSGIIAPFCGPMLFAQLTPKFNGHVSVAAPHKSAINVDKACLS